MPLHEIRARFANLQALLLGPDGLHCLHTHRALLRALTSLITHDIRFRKIDTTDALASPIVAAHIVAQLTVDKAYDRRALAQLAAQAPAISDTTIAAGLDEPTIAHIRSWRGARATRKTTAYRLPEPRAVKRFAHQVIGVGMAASLESMVGFVPWGPILLAIVAWLWPPSLAAMLGGALATSVAAQWIRHQWPTAARTLAQTSQRPLRFEDMARLLEAVDQTKINERTFQAPSHAASDLNTVTCIEQSCGVTGSAAFSRPAIATAFRDFAFMSSLTSLAKRTDPHAWHHYGPAVALAMLNHLGWDPCVLWPERLAEVRRLQDAGDKLIFVANHRSYYDILACTALLRGFRPTIIAKRELTYMPWLGRTPLEHPWQPWRWFDDSPLADNICIWRSSKRARPEIIEKSLAALQREQSILVFGPGTRTRTLQPGSEAGLAPYKTGAMNIAEAATAQGMRVTFVPIHLVGLGSIFGSSPGSILARGIGINQPVLLGLGDPVTYFALRERIQHDRQMMSDPRQRVRHLTRLLWAHCARNLLPLQAWMRGV